MNKEKLLALLKKKEERKKVLVNTIQTAQKAEEIRSAQAEIIEINSEIADINGMVAEIETEEARSTQANNANVAGMAPQEGEGKQPEGRSKSPVGTVQVLGSYGIGDTKEENEKREAALKRFETRGANLKAKRSVTFELDEMPELRAISLGSSNLVAETKYSPVLNDTFNQVSSTIDLVNAVPLIGGESYEKGFVTGYGEGGYTTETGDYEETDATFDYVSIGKAKITAYTEMSDEAMKLPNVDYQAMVKKNISIALRKKISKQILAGAGGANAVTGIFKAPTNVIPTASDIEITKIDADTLDKIVLNYGGDEDVEGSGYLILNKKDLASFAAVRSTTGEKLYKIKLNGNTGTISSSDSFEVPFVINSAVPAFADAATDAYCMAYGMMSAYEMPIFSAVTVEESRDFKFRTGQVAYRGSVWAGGNVASYKGFVRVKKVAAV